MSEERRDQAQEEARRVLSPVRLAVLLLLGALFLVVGGSRADAAEAGPAPDQATSLLGGTLASLDAGGGLTAVGTTVDGLVHPVLTAADPVVRPIVQPVVEPVVAPVATPLRPVVERVARPVAALAVLDVVAPPAAPAVASAPVGAAAPQRVVHGSGTTTAVDHAGPAAPSSAAAASPAAADTQPVAPASGTPVSRTAATPSSDGGAGSPASYAVLLTAFAAVLLLVGGVAPGRVAAPIAPTFLPPVFPG